jgi:hypothetical protein
MLELNYYDPEVDNFEVLMLDFEYTRDWRGEPQATYARLYRLDKDGEPVAVGAALRHPLDNFERRTGRKIAFERAVNSFTHNKEIRFQLWRDYLKQVKV